MISKKNEQTILCILDGWGISKRVKGNAVKLARKVIKTKPFKIFLTHIG